jgi:hypothetical protein
LLQQGKFVAVGHAAEFSKVRKGSEPMILSAQSGHSSSSHD